MPRKKGDIGPGTWQKGQSGNPEGKAEIRPFLKTLRMAIAQDNNVRLRKCAETLLDLAATGEPWAAQMLADRLDGKATQEVLVKREARDMSLDEILAELATMESAKTGTADGGEKNQAGAAKPGIVH